MNRRLHLWVAPSWREIEEAEAVSAHEVELRAQDPGSIKTWMLLAPISSTFTNGALALAQEQIPNEAGLRPRVGDKAKFENRELVWKAVQLENHLLDFNQFVGQPTEWSVAYAVSYIQSPSAQTNLVMSIGSDDQSKVYLNGKETHRSEQPRSYYEDEDTLTGVNLKAGLNVLVFKVVNERVDWQGSVRLTDAAGQPVGGIRVTVAPDSP
jgi:hypothetical protein